MIIIIIISIAINAVLLFVLAEKADSCNLWKAAVKQKDETIEKLKSRLKEKA